MDGSGPIAAVKPARGGSSRSSAGGFDLGMKEDPKAVFERLKLEARAEASTGHRQVKRALS